MQETEFVELFKKAKNGDQKDLNKFFQVLYVRIRPIARHNLYGYGVEDIEDVIQDTIVGFLKKIHRIKDPKNYAITICHNKCNEKHRKKYRKSAPVNSIDAQKIDEILTYISNTGNISYGIEDSILAGIDRKNQLVIIKESLKHLSDYCREFTLLTLKNTELKEILAILKNMIPNLTDTNFYTRNHRCREDLITEIRNRKKMEGILS